MKSPITIDFVNSIIIVNAAYAKKASNPFSQEYEQLQRVRADYPTYAVITRTIKKNSEKESYKGLTYDYMRAYIMSHEEGENRVKMVMEFDEFFPEGNTVSLLLEDVNNRINSCIEELEKMKGTDKK